MGKFLIGEYGRKTWEFLIDADLTNIGRDPDNDMVLQDAAVSRRHAMILRQGRRFLVQDAGSSNGVFLNDERIPARSIRALRDGDRLRMGKCVLLLVLKLPGRRRPSSQSTSAAMTNSGPGPPEQSEVSLFQLQEVEASLVFGPQDRIPARIRVASDRVIIGSADRCDIVLSHPSVSEEHAEIVYNQEGFQIVDRESREGTFHNGTPVVVAALRHRSFLRFGSVKALFVFYEPGKDRQDVSFHERDKLFAAFPEQKSEIQSVFRECREEGLDFVEELVLHGTLSVEECWRVVGEVQSSDSGSGFLSRRRWLPWGKKRR